MTSAGAAGICRNVASECQLFTPAAARETGGVERLVHAPPLFLICYYLPEQKAQQSAEVQQPACVWAVLAAPSAITAINNITFNVFIVFSYGSGKSCR
jgi:hypothetical protein